MVGDELFGKLQDDIELLDGAGAEFDIEKVSHGKQTPVFFGSALTNFGIEIFLNYFLEMTSHPLPRKCNEGISICTVANVFFKTCHLCNTACVVGNRAVSVGSKGNTKC